MRTTSVILATTVPKATMESCFALVWAHQHGIAFTWTELPRRIQRTPNGRPHCNKCESRGWACQTEFGNAYGVKIHLRILACDGKNKNTKLNAGPHWFNPKVWPKPCTRTIIYCVTRINEVNNYKTSLATKQPYYSPRLEDKLCNFQHKISRSQSMELNWRRY